MQNSLPPLSDSTALRRTRRKGLARKTLDAPRMIRYSALCTDQSMHSTRVIHGRSYKLDPPRSNYFHKTCASHSLCQDHLKSSEFITDKVTTPARLSPPYCTTPEKIKSSRRLFSCKNSKFLESLKEPPGGYTQYRLKQLEKQFTRTQVLINLTSLGQSIQQCNASFFEKSIAIPSHKPDHNRIINNRPSFKQQLQRILKGPQGQKYQFQQEYGRIQQVNQLNYLNKCG